MHTLLIVLTRLKIITKFAMAVCLLIITSDAFSWDAAERLIIDHRCTKLSEIPQTAIEEAKSVLHIAYGHTSHGSQIYKGMEGLIDFKGYLYSFNDGGVGDALDLRSGLYDDGVLDGAHDLGNPSRTAWAEATRNYLDYYPEINVIMWSWCGQASTSESNIELYLNLMHNLEQEYPDVQFIYMTGHLNGGGLLGTLHRRNEQIRNYCIDNNKILYDFADIETWDPDGNYFGDKIPDDDCSYDSDGNGTRDANWAIEWQTSHIEGVDWYQCSSAHSQPLNANQKAYAAWWLWARLAGWGGPPDTDSVVMGDISGDDKVTALDAALAARYAIRLINLSESQIIKADVDKNGRVTAYDAALIARYAVGIITSFLY